MTELPDMLQQKLLDSHPDPANAQWRMLVGCICLNLTTRAKAEPVLDNMFRVRYPYPASIARVAGRHYFDLRDKLRTLGLQHMRAKRLVEFSRAWELAIANRGVTLEERPLQDWELRELPGIGDYAIDSYAVFVRGELDREGVADEPLIAYLEAARA